MSNHYEQISSTARFFGFTLTFWLLEVSLPSQICLSSALACIETNNNDTRFFFIFSVVVAIHSLRSHIINSEYCCCDHYKLLGGKSSTLIESCINYYLFLVHYHYHHAKICIHLYTLKLFFLHFLYVLFLNEEIEIYAWE